jgi:phosphatidylethanolamine-binding protein (PEBP) family uncharacterized protein
MAQGTGADCFLGSLVSSARARAFALALAVVALAVSGCGGGSDVQTASQQSTAEQGQAAGETSSAQPDSAAADALSSEQGGDANDGGSSTGEGGKHGARITLPKGPQEHGPTPAERADATLASISLSSPALRPGLGSTLVLPASYTCDGKDSWPALRWAGVPEGTAELALFAMNLQPVNEELFVDWAVTGIDPDLDGIEAGTLPKSAVTGRNSYGKNDYSICPTGSAETYVFILYALPQHLRAMPE